MSVVRPSPLTRAPPLELLKSRVDCIVRELDTMKRDLKSSLEEMKKDIKYLEDRLDLMIETYRDEYHAMSSTNKGK
jgi:predicted RNase H-like nuclease (RuvC/YqgF family)